MRREAGLCLRCPNPAVGGGMCAACRKKVSAATAAWRALKLADGLCPYCGEAIDEQGRSRCRGCLNVASEKRRLRLADGGASIAVNRLCGRCGEPGHYRPTCTSDVDLADVPAVSR